MDGKPAERRGEEEPSPDTITHTPGASRAWGCFGDLCQHCSLPLDVLTPSTLRALPACRAKPVLCQGNQKPRAGQKGDSRCEALGPAQEELQRVRQDLEAGATARIPTWGHRFVTRTGWGWDGLQGIEAAQMPSHPLASELQELTRAASPHVPEHRWE